jgi:hypothetical protein
MPRICGVSLALFTISIAAAQPRAPEILPDAPKLRPVLLPGGELRCYRPQGPALVSLRSSDNGRTWSKPQEECPLPQAMGGGVATLDKRGEIHVILMHARGSGMPAATRFIDLWHCGTSEGRTKWTEAKRIWEGYCGSVMDVKVLSSGRIVVPFAAWKKLGEEVAPDTGSNYSTAVYSDDGGQNWTVSPSKLTAPCTPGYNGNNYGAIEPTILELKDGRVWMLMRTQAGMLYESFSKDGADWSPAQPTKFRTSTSPAALERLADGRIILFWNHCEMPPRHAGQGVYGGRDALHAAISADEGRSWQGFREVYRDPRRNETPPKTGDRGTAYPLATTAQDGTVILATGQGNRRNLLLIDPAWITATQQSDDFSRGLEAWHIWKEFGPAAGFWRDRKAGPQPIDHPSQAGKKALLIARPDELDADCASWNFAASSRGKLTLRLMPRAGWRGLSVALTDRFFNPGDGRGETEAVFCRQFGTDELPSGQWTELTFDWDLAKSECRVTRGGELLAPLPVVASTPHGVSYLRLRSLAKEPDAAGCLVESVSFSNNAGPQ